MNRLFGRIALVAFAWLPVGVWASHTSQNREIVDVFPAQTWASIAKHAPASQAVVAADEPVTQPVAPPTAPAPNPFELLGEWRDNRSGLFLVRGPADQTFIVCGKGCTVNDAIRPGQELVDGYRVTRFSAAGLQITAANGVIYELPVSGLDP